tara:strand:+ start:309 stop:875 length:567 start_codon:yes stop_codon:yes gene_type:complete
MSKTISALSLIAIIFSISIIAIKSISANSFDYNLYPKDQKIFIDTINKYRKEFDPGSNDLKKNKLFRNRSEEMCGPSFSPNNITEWVGKIKEISTNLDGKGILAVEIDRDVRVETWNNAFSDILSDTLIEIDTKVYDQLIDLKEGEVIKFNGFFFSNEECIETQNLFLHKKIMKPSFTFKFTNLQPFS